MSYNKITNHPRLKVILCQLPYIQVTLESRRKGNIPLAGGYLKAMAYKEKLLNEISVEILDSMHNDLDGDERLVDIIVSKKPDILGFSLYPWNGVRSLFVAGEVKKNLPQIKVIVGGPEVTSEPPYVLSSLNIDIGVFGEGEIPFVNLLKFFLKGKPDLSEIGGIFYKKNGRILVNHAPTPFNELDEIPSPYLLGFIDPSKYDRMMIEIMRGCPCRCKYCSENKVSLAKKPFFSSERIKKELKLAKEKGVKLIEFRCAALNILPNFKEIVQVIKEVNSNRSMLLGFELMAELVNEDTANLLKECNVKFCEVGLQSTNPQVLANIDRVNNLQKFLEGVKLLKDKRLKLAIDIILGLPGDTLDTFKETLNFLKENQLISDVIFPTILSVGPATAIRKEAKRFGLKYQSEPPYRVIETNTLSYGDLRSALNLCTDLMRNEIPYYLFYPSMATYIKNNYSVQAKNNINSGNHTKFKERILDYPITKIILEFDKRFLKSRELKRLGNDLSKCIANVLTIWFKCPNLTNKINPIKNFLSAISERNPYIIWNVLLESRPGFPPYLIQEIKDSISYKINNLDYDSFFLSEKPLGFSRQATRLFIIIEAGSKEVDESWLRETNKSASVIWSVELGSDNNYEEKIKNLLKKLGDALLIEFSHDLDTDFILKVLRLIYKESRNYKKTILFKSFLLQQLWDVAFQKIAISLGEREHIINFKQDVTPYSFIFQGREVLPDMLKRFAVFNNFHRRNQNLNRTVN